MTTRRSRARRTIALLPRDALGRFMRVLPTLDELAAAAAKQARGPRRRQVSVSAVQLALF
jgi:hypothetical protein